MGIPQETNGYLTQHKETQRTPNANHSLAKTRRESESFSCDDQNSEISLRKVHSQVVSHTTIARSRFCCLTVMATLSGLRARRRLGNSVVFRFRVSKDQLAVREIGSRYRPSPSLISKDFHKMHVAWKHTEAKRRGHATSESLRTGETDRVEAGTKLKNGVATAIF